MPANPKLDEDRIAYMLRETDLGMTPNGVRSLMSLVLIACYDRKVEREFMAEMIDLTAEIGILMANMESAAKLRAAMKMLKPGAELTKMDEEIQGICRAWKARRASVADKFDKVRGCPTLLDTIQ